MKIILNNVEKRLNSLTIPDMVSSSSGGYEVEVEVRGDVSVTNPTFILTTKTGNNAYYNENYVYVPLWNRFYFIENVIINGNRQEIICSEDYLASWSLAIRNSTFYCARSASDYNENITDVLFPAEVECNSNVINVSNPWKNIRSGNYIVAIASGGNDVAHIGTNVYYVLSDTEMTNFMDDLMSKAELSLEGLADSIVKTMVNPMQYIRSCYWFPCDIDANTQSVDSIQFGWWSADASAKCLQLTSSTDTNTELTVKFEYDEEMFKDDDREYMKYPPYSHYTLTMYPFGVFELPQRLITQLATYKQDIICRITVDHLSGMGELQVFASNDLNTPFIVSSCQVAVEVPVGEILQDYMGAITDVLGAGSSLLSGNVAGAVNGIHNALDDVTPQSKVEGIAGGFAQLMLNSEWNLIRYKQSVNPQKEFMGEPCCENKKVGDLDGFAVFLNVEIEGNMMKEEKEAIKNLLEGGIFINA